MQLQFIVKEQRQGELNQLLLQETQSKSQRSSLSSQKQTKLQLSKLTPTRMAKQRSKKVEVDRKGSSMVGDSEMSRLQQPQEFQTAKETEFVYNKYDIWDLTYSLISAKIDRRILIVLFIVQVSVRYFSIVSLVYITICTYSEQWEWVFILIFTNTLYFICIVKLSLKPAQTQSEFILKESFNSLEHNQAQDYFQVISPYKFFTSVARGLVPPQFSCLYIWNSERRAQIYAMINYIYSSIEAVIYYPFFIIYMIIIVKKDKQLESRILLFISLGLIALFQLVFIMTSAYLVIHGCKKKGYFKSKDK